MSFYKDYKLLISDTISFIKSLSPPPITYRKKGEKIKIKEIDQKKKIKPQTSPLPLKKPMVPKNIAPTPSKEIKEVKPTIFLQLEKPKTQEKNLEKVKKALLLEGVKILEDIPDDKKAKKLSSYWKIKKDVANIVVLHTKESPKNLIFLKNLTFAIDKYFKKAKLLSIIELEKNNTWDQFLSQDELKLILICDHSIWSFKTLMKHYREIPIKREYFLDKVPLFMLPDISIYLKEPLLKRVLWSSILKKIEDIGI